MKTKNRVIEAQKFHWFGSGRHFRLQYLLIRHLDDLSDEEVVSFLNMVDGRDMEKRSRNFSDNYFERLVPIFSRHDKALKFLNTYGYICETYVSLLKINESNRVEFEIKLLQNEWLNVFAKYLKKHGLSSETKEFMKGTKHEGLLSLFAKYLH